MLAAAPLTGCSTANTASSPAPTVTSPQPTPSSTDTLERCTKAVDILVDVERHAATPSTDGSRPPACTGLSENAYLDIYLSSVRRANEEGRDELQRQIDEAAEADAS
ncbi:hypothetical protein CK936_23350 [Streptomyces albireticuli]|uniref:Uncharacterized protein n=1 Tax=Streptomyces albireticuli TaxID=1940 RepID=A0A2A2D5K4_9ACTN|nr:hypothetical protein CK936_23350 [Streptomyces albireticuli]